MRRSLFVVAACLLVSSVAEAAPSGAPAGNFGVTRGTPPTEAAILAAAAGVNLAASSVVLVELATGKKQLAASGVSLVLTAPTLIFLGNEMRHDPGNLLLIGATAWTASLVAKSVIDLIIYHDPTTELSNRRIIIQPMFDPGAPSRPTKPTFGVDLSGTF